MCESCFEVGGLGRAASPRPPRRAIDSVVSGIAHARILHAKAAKSAKVGRGIQGGADAVTFPHSQECRNVRKCEGVKVVLKLEA